MIAKGNSVGECPPEQLAAYRAGIDQNFLCDRIEPEQFYRPKSAHPFTDFERPWGNATPLGITIERTKRLSEEIYPTTFPLQSWMKLCRHARDVRRANEIRYCLGEGGRATAKGLRRMRNDTYPMQGP
jgi:hypothetical protein